MGLFDFLEDAISEVVVRTIKLPVDIIESVGNTLEKIEEKLKDSDY